MSRSTRAERSREAAFTLVEALAALAVMAVSMAAIGALSNASLRTGLYVERHLAQIQTARKVVAGLPGRAELRDGTQTGTLDGHRWRLDTAPFANALAPLNAPLQWRPQAIALRVLSPSGSIVEVDMVRLTKVGGR